MHSAILTQKQPIRAIETRYKGYLFRSRLEARWAVFFDSLRVEWQYEPEGFDLGEAGWYLPDFFLPNIQGGLWVEIKGASPTDDEIAKLIALCKGTGTQGTFRVGDPMSNILVADGGSDSYDIAHDCSVYDGDGGCDYPYIFCLCPWCGKVGFEYDGRGARVCGYKEHYETKEKALDAIKHLGHWRADDKCYTGADERIVVAAHASRSARFEHGQSGAIA